MTKKISNDKMSELKYGDVPKWLKGPHSKHSRVCHTPIFETPLFIGVYAECNCTFRILHLAVFSHFGIKAQAFTILYGDVSKWS